MYKTSCTKLHSINHIFLFCTFNAAYILDGATSGFLGEKGTIGLCPYTLEEEEYTKWTS